MQKTTVTIEEVRSRIATDVRDIIHGFEQQHADIIRPDIVSIKVMEGYGEISGKETDVFILATYSHVRKTVRQAFNKRYNKPEDAPEDGTLLLEGFERLQRWYLVAEDKDAIARHIEDLSVKQLLTKADEYDKMAVGCALHADELRRYADTKQMAM